MLTLPPDPLLLLLPFSLPQEVPRDYLLKRLGGIVGKK